MQVQFTSEQEAQLARVAIHNGTIAEELVKNLALRFLHEENLFLQGVQEGIDAADRGDFVESTEVWAHVERILGS